MPLIFCIFVPGNIAAKLKNFRFMDLKNGSLVIEKADIEPFSHLLFDSLLNDLYLLREVNLTDYSKNKINEHINQCISMIQMLFSVYRVE